MYLKTNPVSKYGPSKTRADQYEEYLVLMLPTLSVVCKQSEFIYRIMNCAVLKLLEA